MRRRERVPDERDCLSRVTRRRVRASPFMVLPSDRRGFSLSMAQRSQQRPEQNDRHERRGDRECDQQDGARVVEVITPQNGRIRSPVPRRSLTMPCTGLPAAVC